ncbi:MAG: hypothetical protein AAFO82_07275, partial [Bacteroidota bacterium]
MKQSLLFTLTLLLMFSLSAQQWKIDTIGFGSKPSIAIDQEDRPHIAFMLEKTSGGFIKHAVLQDTGFQETL